VLGSPHSKLLGSEFLDWNSKTQTARMRFTVRPEMTTWRGGVQGGLVAGYLDDVMGYAYVASTGGEAAPLNLEFSMSLIRLVPADATLIATGKVVKAGRRVLFLEAELHDEEGRLLARATSTAIPTLRPSPDEPGGALPEGG
jgi:uncharacterized protein (TIGR00369 family)